MLNIPLVRVFFFFFVFLLFLYIFISISIWFCPYIYCVCGCLKCFVNEKFSNFQSNLVFERISQFFSFSICFCPFHIMYYGCFFFFRCVLLWFGLNFWKIMLSSSSSLMFFKIKNYDSNNFKSIFVVLFQIALDLRKKIPKNPESWQTKITNFTIKD